MMIKNFKRKIWMNNRTFKIYYMAQLSKKSDISEILSFRKLFEIWNISLEIIYSMLGKYFVIPSKNILIISDK